MENKIVVAVTGASGALYAKRLLQKLEGLAVPQGQCSVVFSGNAKDIWAYELNEEFQEGSFPYRVFDRRDFKAPFASGSGGYRTMVVIPCSMGTMGRLATGVSDDLITRAADVMLKERGRLILVPRETPYNLIHLRNMTTLTEAGAVIVPATPSFYSQPQTIEQLVDTVVDRVLELAGFGHQGFSWGS
ncbi:MAG: UbiX family flavin prenyltransferase [Marinilabiliales bacterium]|nr:UbiX family flavin prenyltransferase [Marinilabiliales bacterium]